MKELIERLRAEFRLWEAPHRSNYPASIARLLSEAATALQQQAAENERLRGLLRQSRDYVSEEAAKRRAMYEPYPSMTRKWKPEVDLLAEIDAALGEGEG